MKNLIFTVTTLIWASCLINATPGFAQEQNLQAKEDTAKLSSIEKGTQPKNIMLSASDNKGPRPVNIGLPASVGGMTILENGLPVTYGYVPQMFLSVWRADASLSIRPLDMNETALSIGEIGVSLNSYSNKGTEKFQVKGAFNSNHFGLLRGDLNVSGPLKNGFYYSVSGYWNYDPGTFNLGFSRNADKTQLYRVVLNKKYNNGKGEIGIQYKYANSKSVNIMQDPYIYRENGKVDALSNFNIGTDSYAERSGRIHILNVLTGEYQDLDVINDLGSTSHVFDIFGKNKLPNGINLDYVARYHTAESGIYNPYLSSISANNRADRRFYYADNSSEYYTGDYVQSAMAIAAPRARNQVISSRFELSKKGEKHSWKVGLTETNFNADKVTNSTYSYYQEVGNQPRQLVREDYVAATGQWVRYGDSYGNTGYNRGMQYYDGYENKLAAYISDAWNISSVLTLNMGARIEWQHVNGEVPMPNVAFDINNLQAINKDWYNKAFYLNGTWKATEAFGVLGGVSYTDLAGSLYNYADGNDPDIQQQKIPSANLGVFFNHPIVSIVSKATYIQRDNFKNNSTYVNPNDPSDFTRKTISYAVQTFGWTTDVMLNPFKNFSLHSLLTLQNPKYRDYAFDVYGTHYDFDGNVARSVSKTIVEIDPSYTFLKNKWRAWVSARYFSQEYANYPNTLFFAGRWETFGGLNFKPNKHLDFSVSVINMLNQSGAQGSISGTNTASADQAKNYYDKPVAGTYIRPFTVEFGVKFKY